MRGFTFRATKTFPCKKYFLLFTKLALKVKQKK